MADKKKKLLVLHEHTKIEPNTHHPASYKMGGKGWSMTETFLRDKIFGHVLHVNAGGQYAKSLLTKEQWKNGTKHKWCE